jgi:hypothetical protein
MVPQEGLEPPLPCENQILSLARLPVPPLGPKLAKRRIIAATLRGSTAHALVIVLHCRRGSEGAFLASRRRF